MFLRSLLIVFFVFVLWLYLIYVIVDVVVVLAVARFDFSLGDSEYHQETLENLKAAVKGTRKLCAVCLLPFF